MYETLYVPAWLVCAWAPPSEKVKSQIILLFLNKFELGVHGKIIFACKGHGHEHSHRYIHRAQVLPQATKPEPQPWARFAKVSVLYRQEHVSLNNVSFFMRGVAI